MADGLFSNRKPLTKDDIRRLKESLPKKVEIGVEGTKVTEHGEEPSDVAPILESHSGEISVPLSAEEIRAFQTYATMLKEKNKVMNLTAVDDDKGIAMKHFIDSLTLCPYIREEEAKAGKAGALSFADVGTGAGFPGLPVKISCPELSVTLMDSLEKRLKFLDEVITALDLKNCTTVHSRAEDAGRNKKYREKYDIVTARAVAKLSVLAEYCLPLVKVGGVFLAMKAHSEEEENDGAKAIALLGGTIEKKDTFKLPGTDMERTIIVVRKIRPTPARFPRKAGTPSKTPIV
ncbi:MAG: 16S rRNA (guanine(527)-N(7))-methyltransferase RsmG [Clostridiales bacterium]|nr:16S rRNA (guanine(527)-N(7))-methyltransferase RsmG [Clostridiales bacterium]